MLRVVAKFVVHFGALLSRWHNVDVSVRRFDLDYIPDNTKVLVSARPPVNTSSQLNIRGHLSWFYRFHFIRDGVVTVYGINGW